MTIEELDHEFKHCGGGREACVEIARRFAASQVERCLKLREEKLRDEFYDWQIDKVLEIDIDAKEYREIIKELTDGL